VSVKFVSMAGMLYPTDQTSSALANAAVQAFTMAWK
jgi:hypothetical protein